MHVNASPAVVRRLVAYGLTNLRKRAGYSQAEAAKYMRCSQGKIANLENSRNLPRLEFIEKLLRHYDAEDEIPRYTELLETAEQRTWWDRLSDTKTLVGLQTFIGLEDGASKTEGFHALLVPGLMQTSDYAREVVRGGQQSDSDLEYKVELRGRRQQALTRSTDPLHAWMVIDECALDRRIGDTATMRGQLEHLVELAELDNVQIQICPASVGPHPGLTGTFEILHFPIPEDPGVVYVETRVRAVWFEDKPEIDQYTQVMNHLRALANTPEESKKLLTEKLKEL
ncbi:Helix-turn-helix domain-containing protein [Actinopolyspora mzabensis]|uniref:Helix-turn-helix domain-containing protein n=1 Tax=Actinopolyspora mzabensis TaxID=995066 RepID=A0A1G9AMG7_ACTMZ|nr:helix-turn-helix transcriptional regulator [Actinopolyspora mzabensis]SDK28569.1 Helix-turn-helix domain-containing protein [Actinopolyspora mzabensis]